MEGIRCETTSSAGEGKTREGEEVFSKRDESDPAESCPSASYSG